MGPPRHLAALMVHDASPPSFPFTCSAMTNVLT